MKASVDEEGRSSESWRGQKNIAVTRNLAARETGSKSPFDCLIMSRT